MKVIMKCLLVFVIVLSITMIALSALTLRSVMELGNMIENYALEQCGDFERIEIVSTDSRGVLFDVYSEKPGIDRLYVNYETLAIYWE